MELEYIFKPKFSFNALKPQIERYVADIFAESLEKQGFVSYNGDQLSWYRVVNHEILQSVYFFSVWRFPFLVNIAYGIHPLYICAPIPQKVYIPRSAFSDTEVAWELREALRGPKVLYEGSSINCLATPKRGLENLENIVYPKFEALQTGTDVYRYYKELYESLGEYASSEWYLDQVIYEGDTTQYPFCLHRFGDWRNILEELRFRTQKQQKILERLQARLEAIESGNTAPYIAFLEKQKKAFTKKLETKLGIQV